MKKLAALAVTIAMTLVGATTLAVQRAEASAYRITALFDKTIGLFEQSDVRVLGVSVGKVASVTPKGTEVHVVMEIDREVKLPAEAIATIVPISLISDRYIQISPPYESGPSLKPGAVLGSSRTRIPAELDDVLANLQKLFEALEAGREDDPGALSDAISNLSAALEGTGSDLDQTLGSVGEISRVINENSEHLDSLIVGLSRVLGALAEQRDQIAALNRDLSGAIGAIAEEQTSLAGSLTGLALLTEQVGSLVRDHRSDLEADIDTLTKTMAVAVAHQDSIIRTNDWLHVLAKGAEQSVDGQGFVHQQSNGIYHIDVRDTHGAGSCPVPFIGCQFVTSPTASMITGPMPIALVDKDPSAEKPSSHLFPVPLEKDVASGSSTTELGSPRERGAIVSMFAKLGEFISRLWTRS